MIDGRNVLEQPVKNDIRINDNIRKIGTGHWGNYKTGCVILYLIQRKL